MTCIGVAGWDYPDWSGVVYPARASRGFDRLAWLARFVDAVEINATFYRPAAPHAAASWVRRVETRAGFRFTAKTHRSVTHEDWSDPTTVVAPTLEGLSPLRDAGMLGALLLQFPQSFHCTPATTDRLARLVDVLAGWPVVVEVRHISWDDDRAAAWMREQGWGWCVVDQPRAGGSTVPARPRLTAETAYLRLHGRNEAAWFQKDAGRDARYDYLYSTDELRPLAESALSLAVRAKALYVIANNHFRGQAVANALQLKHLIQGITPEAPPELAASYPQLSGVVRTKPDRLF